MLFKHWPLYFWKGGVPSVSSNPPLRRLTSAILSAVGCCLIRPENGRFYLSLPFLLGPAFNSEAERACQSHFSMCPETPPSLERKFHSKWFGTPPSKIGTSWFRRLTPWKLGVLWHRECDNRPLESFLLPLQLLDCLLCFHDRNFHGGRPAG